MITASLLLLYIHREVSAADSNWALHIQDGWILGGCLVDRRTFRGKMPVRFSDMSNLASPKTVSRLLEMLFTCAAFSLARAAGLRGWSEAFATFAMFTWCFSFAATLLVFLAEFTQFHSLLALSWKSLPVTVAAFSALMNMAASVTYPLMVLSVAMAQENWSELSPPYQIAAALASCLAFLAYSVELLVLLLLLNKDGEGRTAYMATGPGLLKVLEVSLACVVCVTLTTVSSPEFAGFRWAVGALCACALLSLAVILIMVGECRARCPFPFPRLLLVFSVLAFLLQGAVLAVWALQLRREARGPDKCSQMNCRWNQMLLSAALIALNLTAYLTDLIYSIQLSCCRS
ncbi:myeloid-associated differentiation marker homolog [Hemiscyllium ocellatum]|uniref:myeloid-associated differentiation marker homolog n=1 Tax=Hemiscyllium ocellatum TaxID=170820 RepID=UPI0029664934|nr:myeloid-associated differentiation marker homolog [Hemiscyllium ocellatum]